MLIYTLKRVGYAYRLM